MNGDREMVRQMKGLQYFQFGNDYMYGGQMGEGQRGR